ncbi:MAG: hypothetical protein IVW54_16745 [Candidatus Binataceae bacterium]|nr:hypothetical protein [Candidatus Binataceae bacterium]
MAKDALIRVNPERTLVEVETPEGEEWGPEPWPEDQLLILSDEEDPDGESYVAVLDGYGNLEPNTLYKLVKVTTLTEEDDLTEEEEQPEQT